MVRPVFAGLVVVCAAALSVACDVSSRDPREDEIVATLARADESLIRTRPRLAEGKLARMAGSPYDFFRGSVPLYAHDSRAGTRAFSSRFGVTVPLVPSLGDPHPENFGVLRAADGSLGFEPNDFDAADRGPYLWDVRRLSAGLALAAMVANPDDPEARSASTAARREVALAGVLAYREGITARARGEELGRYVDFSSPILADLASRADRDAARARELVDLTLLEGGARRFRRGGVDPEDTQSVHGDLPEVALAALPDCLERARRTLVAPPPPEFFRVLDAVREYGSGVASFARVRALVLVRGPSDDPSDDVIVEVKELVDSGLAGQYPPFVYADSVGRRIVETSRLAWARPDAEPLWGTSTWLGLTVQMRRETEGQKGVRVERMVGARGTKDALVALAKATGTVLARVHTQGPEGVANARALYRAMSVDLDGFVNELADFGDAYAASTMADHAHFVHGLRTHGMRLGVPFDPSDAPSPDLAALFGNPPAPPPLPELP